MWQQDKSPEAPGRLENLKELVRALADFETLAGFLDHVVAGDGERRERRGRPGQPDDPARRQGAGVRHRVPAGLGGGPVPQPARAGRGRAEGAGGGAAARLCRPDPRAAARHRQPRRQPAHLRQLAEQHPQPVPRGTAGRACRAYRVGGAGARRADAGGDQRSAASSRWWRGARGRSRRGSSRRGRRGPTRSRSARGCSTRNSATAW